MAKIAIFRSDITPIGGIETWLYNIALQYHKTHDITIYYGNIDKKQFIRLSRLVKVEEYTGQKIRADRAIFCYDFMGFETVKAKKKIYMVHADYLYGYNMNWKPPGQIDEVYAVSKQAAKSASDLFGREVEVMYNLLPPGEEHRPMKLISATRLTTEKGLHRMQALAKALDKANVDYEWEIYTSSYEIPPFGKGVIFKKPTLNIEPKIKNADFLIQLSDTESFGYSMVEAKMMGTGLVATKLPVLPELFINEHNAVLVDLEDNEYSKTVEKMVSQYQYVPPRSDYNRLLGKPGKVDYNPQIVKNITLFDIMLPDGRWVEPDQVAVIENYDGKTKGLKEI